jgi:hypothetical protein
MTIPLDESEWIADDPLVFTDDPYEIGGDE